MLAREIGIRETVSGMMKLYAPLRTVRLSVLTLNRAFAMASAILRLSCSLMGKTGSRISPELKKPRRTSASFMHA